MTSKKYKLDIFAILKKISYKFQINDFTEEEEKEIIPIVIMRWLSGSNSEKQIWLLNQGVNKFIFPLYNHKRLLINLMKISCTGKFTKYKWIKKKSNITKTKNKNSIEVISEYYNYSKRQSTEALAILNPDVILKYALLLGKPPDFIKKLKKELKEL